MLEFKKVAASLVNEKGYTHQQTADHLDIQRQAEDDDRLTYHCHAKFRVTHE
ncbi:MAG: hypothetical protein H0V39_01805 [Nitrosomonas sp.]|nr:hypothetical protein [Nitrosomonas sp.]